MQPLIFPRLKRRKKKDCKSNSCEWNGVEATLGTYPALGLNNTFNKPGVKSKKQEGLTDKAWRSPILFKEEKANSNAVLRVRSSSKADSNGSKWGPFNPCRTTDKSLEGRKGLSRNSSTEPTARWTALCTPRHKKLPLKGIQLPRRGGLRVQTGICYLCRETWTHQRFSNITLFWRFILSLRLLGWSRTISRWPTSDSSIWANMSKSYEPHRKWMG